MNNAPLAFIAYTIFWVCNVIAWFKAIIWSVQTESWWWLFFDVVLSPLGVIHGYIVWIF